MTNEKHFLKTIGQREPGYGLFANLQRIIVVCIFSPSLFKLKRGILPLLTKYASWYEYFLSHQAKIFLGNQTPREPTPCKISHMCHCDFNIRCFHYITTFCNMNKHAMCLKLSAIFFIKFYFFTKWNPFRNYEKCFSFYIKSSFRSWDVPIFVIFSLLF